MEWMAALLRRKNLGCAVPPVQNSIYDSRCCIKGWPHRIADLVCATTSSGISSPFGVSATHGQATHFAEEEFSLGVFSFEWLTYSVWSCEAIVPRIVLRQGIVLRSICTKSTTLGLQPDKTGNYCLKRLKKEEENNSSFIQNHTVK